MTLSDGKPCPLCGEGVLHLTTKTVMQDYKGHRYDALTRGALCDHCAEGFVEFDAEEESAWLVFRDRVDATTAHQS
ncbi:MAG: hypothetical protein WAO71_02740 [Gallionella sp.]